MGFNLINGYLLGTWIASDPVSAGAEKSLWFWVGVAIWAAGLGGNGEADLHRFLILVRADYN